jgi:hypothetical protein
MRLNSGAPVKINSAAGGGYLGLERPTSAVLGWKSIHANQ